LAYILQPGETAPFEGASAVSDTLPKARPVRSGPAQAAGRAARSRRGQLAISPRARRVAGELGVDLSGLQGSGRSGRIVERDVRQAAREAPARLSPLARRVASQLGVDVEQLAAAAPGRRLRREDVEAAGPPPATVPLSGVRRLVAERMAASAHTAAAVTLTSEADATELVRLRAQLKADIQPVPGYTDLLAKLVARALTEHPDLNARLEGDAILQSRAVNIGIAVDTERGLLVPVLRDAQEKSLRQVAAESAVLVEQARAGRISPDDLRGGTFTITNLGMYDIDAFTPIINLPECAVLGVGRIVPKQVVVDAGAGRLAIRHMLFLSLTFDHRLVDGAPAARFLQRVKQYVEKPYLWLVE
jgi:pyruvate dehydrogenase E2 component (dihydrolipoamide acetyltransferase)